MESIEEMVKRINERCKGNNVEKEFQKMNKEGLLDKGWGLAVFNENSTKAIVTRRVKPGHKAVSAEDIPVGANPDYSIYTSEAPIAVTQGTGKKKE